MPRPASRVRDLFALGLACALCATSAASALALAPAATRWVAHPVQPFEMMATEATVGEYLQCVAAGHCTKESADAACNAGDPAKAQHPVNCINHEGAATLCAHLGGRLCSGTEWLSACRGSDGRAFPYGPEFQPSRCQVGSYDQAAPGGRTTLPAGSLVDCQGGLPGLFDLSGNVGEWLADCKGDYCKFRGAAYVGNAPVEHFAGCGEVCSGNDKGLKSGAVGVRCCRDRPAH